jgi:hypothetical protein
MAFFLFEYRAIGGADQKKNRGKIEAGGLIFKGNPYIVPPMIVGWKGFSTN